MSAEQNVSSRLLERCYELGGCAAQATLDFDQHGAWLYRQQFRQLRDRARRQKKAHLPLLRAFQQGWKEWRWFA